MKGWTFGDYLFLVNSGLAAAVVVQTALDYVRHRDRSRLDILLMFSAHALSMVLTTRLVWSLIPWAVTVGVIAGFAGPLLKYQLLDHFRPLNRTVYRLGLCGMTASTVAVLHWQPSGAVDVSAAPIYLQVLAVAYYGFFQLGVALNFIKEARRTRGITHWRLSLVAAGSVFFVSTFTAEFLGAAFGFPDLGVQAFRVFMTLSTVSYWIGLAPPRALRKLLQLTELFNYLQANARRPVQVQSLETLSLLCPAAVRAVGGVQAMVWLQERPGHLTLWQPDRGGTYEITLSSADSVISRAWHEQRPLFSEDSTTFGQLESKLAGELEARGIIAVPIATHQYVMGVLVVFLRYGTLFPEDDIALLSLMVEHEARYHELERLNRSKSEFLAAVSHDLRTPLTVLMAHVEAVRRGIAKDPEHSMSIVQQKGEQLKELVDDLFKRARLDGPHEVWQFQRVDITELVRRCIISALPVLEEAGLEVEAEIPDKPCWVNAASSQLERVLDNLLTNVRKYGASGHWLGARITREGGWVEVTISDRGPGVPSEQAGQVFERYYQSVEQEEGRGAGLGLAIAKEIVARHGGRIGVRRGDLGGAEFWFCLPEARSWTPFSG